MNCFVQIGMNEECSGFHMQVSVTTVPLLLLLLPRRLLAMMFSILLTENLNQNGLTIENVFDLDVLYVSVDLF